MQKDKKRQITKKEKVKVLEIYEGRCNRCDYVFQEGDYIEYDHIVPHAIGGKSEISNIQPICFKCKSIKNPDDTSKIARIKRYRKKTSEEFTPSLKSDSKLDKPSPMSNCADKKMKSYNALESGVRKLNTKSSFPSENKTNQKLQSRPLEKKGKFPTGTNKLRGRSSF